MACGSGDTALIQFGTAPTSSVRIEGRCVFQAALLSSPAVSSFRDGAAPMEGVVCGTAFARHCVEASAVPNPRPFLEQEAEHFRAFRLSLEELFQLEVGLERRRGCPGTIKSVYQQMLIVG